MNNLVSIITPCYNSEKFISETIKSVQNQTHVNWEMLITDDGSTDNSVKIIKELIKKDKRIKLFLIDNSGPAVARNNSINIAKGSYLAFLDSDDLWFPEFLKISLHKIKNSEGFIFSSYQRVHEKTLKPIYKDFIVPKKVTYSDILKSNSISCLTAFIDIKKLGKETMPNISYRQDMGLWLKYLKKVKYAYGNFEVLASYRIRKGSLSRNKKQLLKPQWNFYRKTEKLSLLETIYYLVIWGYKGLRKYQ